MRVPIVDERDPREMQQSGKTKGAIAVLRGLLELSVAPDLSPIRICRISPP
jgi:hypothetical protein